MVSIVINTKNEEKNLSVCLKSLEKQTFKDFEIIVVDNFSTDKTLEIAQSFGARTFTGGPERSEQRNFGAKKARGEFLLFLDADMEPTENILSESISKIGQDLAALVIPEISVGEGFWSACRALEKKMYFGDASIEAPRFFRPPAFFKVGGYRAGMISGEDWDLRNRILSAGFKIGRAESLIYHHEGHLTLFQAARKKFYYARYSRGYLSRNPPSVFSVLKFLIRPAFWKNWKYLWFDPLHFLGMIFLKILEFGAGFFGLIFSKRVKP